MKYIKFLLILFVFATNLYSGSDTDNKLHLLVNNDRDYAIAKDILSVTKDKINLTIYFDTYLNIVNKLLTDKMAQFGILPHNMIYYQKYINKNETFTNKIKMILPLYDSYIHIIVKKSSGIKGISDLQNRRVGIDTGDNKFSITGETIKYKYHISWLEYHFDSKVLIDKLISDDLDAIILTEPKPSKLLKSIPVKKGKLLTLLSLDIGDGYHKSYINSNDYKWLDKEIVTNIVTMVLASYNYHESKTIKRFNYYTKNITNIVRIITRELPNLRKNGYYLWKTIEPYYYKRVSWPLHYLAKNVILENMGTQDSFVNTIGMKFVKIKSGEFTMGDDDSRLPLDEKPAHKERVEEFYMMTTEVTQKSWAYVMDGNPSLYNSKKLGYYAQMNPVDSISIKDAKEFVDRLNILEGGFKYRLPSEAEWEYVADIDDKNISKYAWFSDNSSNQPHRVGLKEANRFGLYDILGNVWEWCDSNYTTSYSKNATIEPYFILRGGSFINLSATVRTKNRMKNIDTIRRFNNGFRIVYDKKGIKKSSILYVVKKGDTLASIAQKYYHNRKRWDVILYFNKAILKNSPSNLKVGQALIIPVLNRVKMKNKYYNPPKRNVTKNAIKFLTETHLKPYQDRSLPNGGMVIDILDNMMKAIGDSDYTLTWEDNSSLVFPYLISHKYDVGVNWFKPNCAREHLSKATALRCKFLFSRPVNYEIATFFRKKEDTNRTKLKIKDLKGKRICRPEGWYIFDLEEYGLYPGKNITMVRPERLDKCFYLLLNNKVDFVAATKILGNQTAHDMGIDDQIESIEEISRLLSSHFIVYPTNPRAKEILDKINRGLKDLEMSGKLQEIKTKHAKNFFYRNE